MSVPIEFTVTPFDSAWISTFFDIGGIFGECFFVAQWTLSIAVAIGRQLPVRPL